MKLSEFSVKHPVIISMALLVLLVFGLYSFSGMTTEFMPDISMPQAIVYSVYPGAAAEDVEQDVTKILEDSFVTLPHFKSISSSSMNSISLITITYQDGVDANEQLEELRNRIRELKDDLPDGLSGEPIALVGGIAMLPIFTFSVDAGGDSGRASTFIHEELTPALTRIDGVSSVNVDGDKELNLSVKLKLDELTSKGIAVTTVYQVLNYGNVNLPLGSGEYENRTIQVRYSGGFSSIEDIKDLPVGATKDNNIIHLGDVADVSLDYPEPDYYVTNGEKPLIIVSVLKRTDGNTIKIIKQIKKVLKGYEESTGGAVKFGIVSDDSRSVNASMQTVIQSGVMGILFAVLVILLFMADWRATVTIGISIPLCVLFSFIGLKVSGISINLMSLSGLVISLGMVVDGSTVMLEQIYRYYKERDASSGTSLYTVNQAIYKGWDEVVASILASSLTTIVVFVPIALLQGLIGKVLHTIAVTIIMAISASFVVSIIIVPYLLKLLLKEGGPKVREKPRKFDVVMDNVEAWYRKLLDKCLNIRSIIIVASVGILLFSGFIATRLGVAFIPSTDNSEFYLSVEFPIGTTVEQTQAKMKIAERLLYKHIPEIKNAVFYEGMSNANPLMNMSSPQSAYAHIILVPVKDRQRNVHEIMLQSQKMLSAVLPDATVEVQNGGFDKMVGYVSDGGGYGLTLISEDMDLLYKTACDLKNFLETDPEVVNVSLNSDFDTTSMIIDMSQEYLSSLGLTSYQAGITTAILFQGIDCGIFKDADTGDRYNIRIESDITDKTIGKDDIANIHIVTEKGQDVSFANLSDIRVEKSISQINHSNRAKTITVTASLVSENTANVSSHVNEYLAKNPLPGGVESEAGGIMALIGEMIGPMITALLIALFLVYTVMVVQFERFKQPLLIMVTIPFCFIGVVAGLMMFGSTLNLLAMMGIISLGGIVVNNGIILVDFINQLRKERRIEIAKSRGHQDKDGEWHVELTEKEEEELLRTCVTDGASSRIKPILITTLTTLLGDIPMAVSHGEGAEIYAPMGQAIVGGLITSTLITLIIIPVLYYMSEHTSALQQSIKDKMNEAKKEMQRQQAQNQAKLLATKEKFCLKAEEAKIAADFMKAEIESTMDAKKKSRENKKGGV